MNQTPSWAERPERGSAVALRAMLWLARRISRRYARMLLLPIVGYFLLTSPAERHASAAFLRRALGRAPTPRDTAEHFHTFAATVLDRVYLLLGRIDELDIRVHNAEVVQACLVQGRGCLAIGSHLGSFDVMRTLSLGAGHANLKILMYPEHNRVVTDLLHELSPEIAEMVIPLGGIDALLNVRDCLHNGDIVGILGDRVGEGDRTTRCRFLGGESTFPAGPMLLAGTMHVPTLLFFGIHHGPNRYDIYFEPLADEVSIRRSSRSQDLQCWTQRYADRLAHYATLAPYNWFNFYDFWTDAPPNSTRRRYFDRPAVWLRYGLLCLGLMLVSPAWPAEFRVDTLMAMLSQVSKSEGRFVELKHVNLLREPLALGGTYRYEAPDYLQQRFDDEDAQSYEVRGTHLNVSYSDGRRHDVDLDEYPVLRGYIAALQATLAGDLPTLTWEFRGDNRWPPGAVELTANAAPRCVSAAFADVSNPGAKRGHHPGRGARK